LTVRFAVAQAVCSGDCDLDSAVEVNELIAGVNIALGAAAVADCTAADPAGDGVVSVSELVSAVNNLLFGCGGGPTPTPRSGLPTATPTITPTLAIGPRITFVGIASADNSLQTPTGSDQRGLPIYQRPFGFGFSLVVEAHSGSAICSETSQRVCAVAESTFEFGAPPDLQVQVNRALGDGSATVCDDGSGDPRLFGGVPGIDPPRLEDPDAIADALNDLGCRFVDGTGARSARRCNQEACVKFEDGEFRCADGTSEFEFCAPIPMPLQFPDGDTLVTVRARDIGGNLGAPAQLIVRVAP
jgi:hypothetical protein